MRPDVDGWMRLNRRPEKSRVPESNAQFTWLSLVGPAPTHTVLVVSYSREQSTSERGAVATRARHPRFDSPLLLRKDARPNRAVLRPKVTHPTNGLVNIWLSLAAYPSGNEQIKDHGRSLTLSIIRKLFFV